MKVKLEEEHFAKALDASFNLLVKKDLTQGNYECCCLVAQALKAQGAKSVSVGFDRIVVDGVKWKVSKELKKVIHWFDVEETINRNSRNGYGYFFEKNEHARPDFPIEYELEEYRG